MTPTNDKVDQSGAAERLRIAHALIALYDSKKESHGVHGQIIGMEPYVIKATGNSLCVLLDAANMLVNFCAPQQAVAASNEPWAIDCGIVEASRLLRVWLENPLIKMHLDGVQNRDLTRIIHMWPEKLLEHASTNQPVQAKALTDAAERLSKALSEAHPREEIDLDDVRAMISFQPSSYHDAYRGAREELLALQKASDIKDKKIAELEKQVKQHDADAEMYARAWERELCKFDGKIFNKRHHIDALVLTTQDLVEKARQNSGAPTQEKITEAAKYLAGAFDYPWDSMPAEGRNRMRAMVEKINEITQSGAAKS